MSLLGSPSSSSMGKLVFWYQVEDETFPAKRESDPDAGLGSVEDTKAVVAKEASMYVSLFEDMLKIVLYNEHFLFSQEELQCFTNYSNLTYNARYLLLRLCLRKTDKWHRLGALHYEQELGDAIPTAIQELCSSRGLLCANEEEDIKSKSKDNVKVKQEVIDLTLDDYDKQPVPGPSTICPIKCEPTPDVKLEPDYSVFAEDQTHAALYELLECLTTEELKALTKQIKLKPMSKRSVLIDALLSSSCNQSTLSFPVVSRYKGKGKEKMGSIHMQQTKLSFRPTLKTQKDRLREIVIEQLGTCIRVNSEVFKLFRRVHLVYFRSTQQVSTLLTPCILTRAHKRSYASYLFARTANIWSSRDELLEYEEAIDLEGMVDALLGSSASGEPKTREHSAFCRTPAPGAGRWKTPVTPKSEKYHNAPMDIKTDGPEDVAFKPHEHHETETIRMQNARAVKAIFEEVYEKWKVLVQRKGEETARPKGLERFDCGHVLTRVVCKGAYALGILKEYEREYEVLQALLGQRRWRLGRRGRWYERRALILMTYFPKTEASLRHAWAAVWEALGDEHTHIVYRPKLVRRLTTLERRLKIPMEDRHFCEGQLAKAEEVEIQGMRVDHRPKLDPMGRIVSEVPVTPAKRRDISVLSADTPILLWSNRVDPSLKKVKTEDAVEIATGKSIWKGRDGEEVSVEILALQHYEDRGYKGFHCEGRIVGTLFALLFWDIIFAPVAGAFETPYQSAPLDIAEDTFYLARQELADARLQEIKEGHAAEILEQVYDEHAKKRTWCVGVRWDLFGKEDLLGITRCLGGVSLAVICQLLCEDYAGRLAGVPDLIIWDDAKGDCKFVEVKGPGDNLQENQKVWINVLLQAGTPVEVCRVRDIESLQEERDKKPSKTKKSTGKRKRKEVNSDLEAESEDEPEIDYSQMDVHSQENVLPQCPKTPSKSIVNRAEVVITSSPHSSQSLSPAVKRRRL